MRRFGVDADDGGDDNGEKELPEADETEDTTTVYKGVYVHKGGFKASIFEGGKMRHLGTRETQRGAAVCYDEHVRSLGGKVVNFPNAAAGEVLAVKGEQDRTTLKRVQAATDVTSLKS